MFCCSICLLYEHTFQLCKDNALLAAVSWFPLKTHINYEGEKEKEKNVLLDTAVAVFCVNTQLNSVKNNVLLVAAVAVLCEYTV